MAAELKRFARPVSALCSVVMAPLAAWYLYPDFLSTCIASILTSFAGLKAWLTAPVLFLLMNVVVLALAFTSGFLKQSQHWGDDEELEDLTKIRKRKHNAEGAEEEDAQEERGKDEDEDDAFYPEVFSSFFGDGVTISRRKPVLQRSASAPLVERKSFFSSISGSRSQKFSSSPSLLVTPQSAKTVSSQPLLKVLRPSHTVPKTSAFELKKPLSATEAPNGNGEDKDVDQRADAFIGDFYKKMKLQKVDPYMERLERSYGR